MRVRRCPRALLAAGLLLTVGVGVKLALDLRTAEGALRHAQAGLAGLRAEVAAGDQAKAARSLRRLQVDAATAAGATDGPLWRVLGGVPLLGRSASSTSVLTRAVDDVARDVLPGLLEASGRLRSLGSGPGNQVDVAALREATPALDAALARTRRVVRALDAGPVAFVLPPVGAARQRVVTGVRALETDLQALATGSRLVPGMLGADGVRRYFVAFQNNAEARGTGGLLGAYAILRADHGRVRVEKLGSDRDLYQLPPPRVDLGPDFAALYGTDLQAWQNANMTGNFPYAARLWLSMWEQHTGVPLDGAFAVDPLALAQLLTVTGPIPLPDDGVLTAANVVAQTESLPYARYVGKETARKDYLLVSARAVLDRILGPLAPSRYALGEAVARAARARQALMFSNHPQEQAWIAGSVLSGEIPDTSGPFAFLVVNNSAGNKIDYYLERTLTYDLAACKDGRRRTTLTAVLRDDVADGAALPPVVAGRLDKPPGSHPPGSTSLLVFLYVTKGSRLVEATVDGAPAVGRAGRERGHPVFVVLLQLQPGQPRTLVLQLDEPASRTAPHVPVQSLVREQVTTVHEKSCP